MDRSLFSFVWRHSLPQQLVLLCVTVATFPLLYATLELPKLIINDAIEAPDQPIAFFSYTLDRVEYLFVLCGAFLAAVLGFGLLKMQLNTMKGVLAERLLRRFRYALVSRILRFPLSHFRRASQGELISMVTAEAEPLGGIMGDALAQPVFQGGQMLTIMAFLFIQNVWLGLAAVALIPLQAWLIPHLQRKINVLNKERLREVRGLAQQLGEGISGAEDLRVNGGVPYALAETTARLGRLFAIRYEIYRRKFFMKFINNFIAQLTPFFFFAIGGYLAIQGELTVGALVAALAAYKDLTPPWKELLAYYTRAQEMTQRYDIIADQFAQPGMIDAASFEGRPETLPHLNGDIVFDQVTLREPDGQPVIDDLSMTIPAGATVAIRSGSANERRALAQLLSRAVLPGAGGIRIGDHALDGLHQGVMAARIGVAGTKPYLFNRSIEDNVQMALRTVPMVDGDVPGVAEAIREARLTGNSLDPFDAPWLDPSSGVGDETEMRAWWLRVIEALGTDDFLFERGLTSRFKAADNPYLAERLVALRPRVRRRVAEAGLTDNIHPLSRDTFNPGLAVAGNLTFALAERPADLDALLADARFLPAIREAGLEGELLALSSDLLSVVVRVFKDVGGGHPLFRRLGLDPTFFAHLQRIAERRAADGLDGLCDPDRAALLQLPFRLTGEQVGAAFPDDLKDKIVALRTERGDALRRAFGSALLPLDEKEVAPGLTVLEDALFAKVHGGDPNTTATLVRIVGDLLVEEGLRGEVILLIGQVEAGIGGANLAPVAHERIAFIRAAIKRPDILILDHALASHDVAEREAIRRRLRDLLPDATLIFLEPEFRRPDDFDLFVEIEDGRLKSTVRREDAETDGSVVADLRSKMRIIAGAPLFADLDQTQQRLLAFASVRFTAEPGELLFRAGDATDGGYLLSSGLAELRWPGKEGEAGLVTVVEPLRVVGELSVILDMDRTFDFVVTERCTGLRIGAGELMDVIRSDGDVAFSLLRTVSGHLVDAANEIEEGLNTRVSKDL